MSDARFALPVRRLRLLISHSEPNFPNWIATAVHIWDENQEGLVIEMRCPEGNTWRVQGFLLEEAVKKERWDAVFLFLNNIITGGEAPPCDIARHGLFRAQRIALVRWFRGNFQGPIICMAAGAYGGPAARWEGNENYVTALLEAGACAVLDHPFQFDVAAKVVGPHLPI